MARARYRYRRSRRRQGAPWWLLFPFAIIIAIAVSASLWLPEDHLRAASAGRSEACADGQGCAAVLSTAVERCSLGGDCSRTRYQPLPSLELAPPAITAPAAAILEEPCGGLVWGQLEHQRRPPASLTKIASTLVAFQGANLSDLVTVEVNGPDLAVTTDSTVMGLEPGQQLSLRDLLYGMLLPSGNDAALAVAQHSGGSVEAFVEMMNEYSDLLGLDDTHFTNPHGLDDPAHYTSAFDIAVLGQELLRQPELAAIVRTRSYQPAWDGPTIENGNRLLQLYPGALGVKTGYTDQAGQTFVGAAERDGRLLIVSLLGSSDIYVDSAALLDWAFSSAPSVCYE